MPDWFTRKSDFQVKITDRSKSLKLSSNQVDNYYVRDMKKFDHENFLEQLDNLVWCVIPSVQNLWISNSIKSFQHYLK